MKYLLLSIILLNSIICTTYPNNINNKPNKKSDILKKYENYLTNIKSMKAKFYQVCNNGDKISGTMIIKKPDKALLAYNDSNTRIYVDNGWIVYKDDKNTNYSSLDSSPLSILLKNNINFQKTFNVECIMVYKKYTQVVVNQKSDPESGKVSLFFSNDPIHLLKWIINNPNGNTIEVKLTEIQYDLNIDDNIFVYKEKK